MCENDSFSSTDTDHNDDDDVTDEDLNVKYIDSLYVHDSILEWFENEILTLHPVNNVIVEEIFHNNFDENINHVVSDRNTRQIVFDRTWMESKYKMCWLSDRTYFIQVDEHYDVVLHELQEELTNYDLTKYILNTYQMEVNWITLKMINVFEFSTDLEKYQLLLIDEIFIKSITNANSIDKILPLYLTVPLPWHNTESNFIDVDTLCIDICAEEWKHYNLLSVFSIEDLLSLELANKDFRVPYYNDYLDRHLQTVLSKKLTFSMEDEEKIEYSLPIFENQNLVGYFIYKYHSKFSKLYTSQSTCKKNFDYITKLLKIPSYEFVYDKVLYLNEDEPDPISLVNRYKGIETIIYIIQDYKHFTGELFYELIQNPNQNQLYEFDFSNGINFTIPVCDNVVRRVKTNIQISVYDSSAENEIKFGNLIKFFIHVLKGHNNTSEILISSCYLSDYTVFENISESFGKIIFNDMQISHTNLLSLAPYLSKEHLIEINFCNNITDRDIVALLQHSNIEPVNLSIDSDDANTPLIYYMLAEMMMDRNKVESIHLNEMMMVKFFEYKFNRKKLEFYKENQTIYLRNGETGEQIDLYCLMNNLPMDGEEPPFEYN